MICRKLLSIRQGKMHIAKSASGIIDVLKKDSYFQNLQITDSFSFSFHVIGRIGLYRTRPRFEIVGQVYEDNEGCVFRYAIRHCRIFWFFTTISLLALIYAIAQFISRGISNTSVIFLLFVTFFQTINFLESAWQAELCEQTIKMHLNK